MGRFVFVANQASNSISVFTIGMNGTLSSAAGSPFAASNPFGLAVNPAGTVLFANNFPDSQTADLNTVSSFQIGQVARSVQWPARLFPRQVHLALPHPLD